MKTFVIKKLPKNKKLDNPLNNIAGYKYIPKIKSKLKISEVTIVSPEITGALITSSFNKKYKRILEFYLTSLDSDDTDSTNGNLILALNEITRLRNIIIKKYLKILQKKESAHLLKRLKLIENEIRTKIIDIELIKEELLVHNNIVEEEKSIHR